MIQKPRKVRIPCEIFPVPWILQMGSSFTDTKRERKREKEVEEFRRKIERQTERKREKRRGWNVENTGTRQ